MTSLIAESNRCTIPESINARRTMSECLDAEMQTSTKGPVKPLSDKLRVVELCKGGQAFLHDHVIILQHRHLIFVATHRRDNK